MSTLTKNQEDTLRAFLNTRSSLAVGIGTYEEPCSLAAINLALTGRLTDRIPYCMSLVIGRWIIVIQDQMPADIRNSQAWRNALVTAAGTGRDHEQARLNLILTHMWDTLALAQRTADKRGHGDTWRTMHEQRTTGAAAAATYATAAVAATAAAYAAVDAIALGAEGTAEEAWRLVDPVGTLKRLVDIEAEQ